ncbi:hypothetical protein P3S68_003134 [Capsicum galapagoense]
MTYSQYTMKSFISSMVLLKIGFIFTILLMSPNVSARWNIDPEISRFGRRLLPQVGNDPQISPRVMSSSANEAKRLKIPGRG